MKLLNEVRFLSVSTLVFMLISMFAVSYLFFYIDVDHHLGNNPGCGTENTNTLLENDMMSTDKEDKGKVLFKSNCARCHYATDQKFIGPGLANVMDRITEDQLLSWVKDPTSVRRKDEYFKKLFKDYNESVMPGFPELSKEDVLSIIAYIETSGNGVEVVAMK